MKALLLVVGLLFLPLPVLQAEEPLSTFPMGEEATRGVSFDIVGRSEALFSGDANKLTYGGRISVDGPIANPWSRPFRLRIDLALSSTPGQSFQLSDLETYGRTARLSFGTTLQLARPLFAENQKITTALYAGAGFTTALEDKLLDRYLRRMELSLEFRVVPADPTKKGAAFFRIGYCRDEVAGYIGVGQACIAGEVPITGTGGVLIFGGESLLNMSRATTSRQRDSLAFYLGVMLDALASLRR